MVQNVQGTLRLSNDAKIVNMSLTGMAVETDTLLRVGRKYSLALRHGEGLSLRLSGTVVWCHLRSLRRSGTTESRPVYEAGFQFDEALTETAGELARILQATAVVAVDKRISGRFKVDLPHPVNLDAAYQLEVKTISAMGVLIETEISPPVDAVIDLDIHLRGARVRAKGRVVNSVEVSPAAGGTINQLGVEFIALSSETRRAIEDFIGRHVGGAAPSEGTA